MTLAALTDFPNAQNQVLSCTKFNLSRERMFCPALGMKKKMKMRKYYDDVENNVSIFCQRKFFIILVCCHYIHLLPRYTIFNMIILG